MIRAQSKRSETIKNDEESGETLEKNWPCYKHELEEGA
jgi:hypothetical protein